MQSLASILPRFERKPNGVPGEELAKREAAEREDLRNLTAKSRLAKTRIPRRYQGASLATCPESVRQYASDISSGGSGWLTLTGKNGRGKTYAACAALLAVMALRTVRFASMQDVLNDVKATFDGTGSEGDVVAKYKRFDVLLLDDLGKENPTDWSLPIIFEVIDGRYKDDRPTIITTNLNADSIVAHYSKHGSPLMAESIVSRIAEGLCIEVEGPDRRLRHG